MRTVLRSRLAVFLLLGTPLLVAAFASPGWRHRHAGGVGHSHGDADQPIGPDDGRAGWHIHLSILGIEVTVWEPGVESAAAVSEVSPERPNRPIAPDETGEIVLLGGSPMTASWVSLIYIEPGPVPNRAAIPDANPAWSLSLPRDGRAASLADAPPLPPPETA